MAGEERVGAWFVANWPRVGLVCAPVTLTLLAALWSAETAPMVLAATLLPVYMLHQYEEHGHGRFVAWFDATVGGGLPVLTAVSEFRINVLGVWVLSLVALLLERFAPWGGSVAVIRSRRLADPLLANRMAALVAVAAHAAILVFALEKRVLMARAAR